MQRNREGDVINDVENFIDGWWDRRTEKNEDLARKSIKISIWASFLT